MPTEPYTPAELEAGAAALREVRHVIDSDGYPSIVLGTDEQDAATVLRAVTLVIERRAQVPLLSLIEDLTEDEPCWYDHGDCCQVHSLNRRPCPHERAKRVLARHATEEAGEQAMAEPTPAEIEVAIAAAEEAWPQIAGWPDQSWMVAALRAVLPDHDARVRAEVAEPYRQRIAALEDLLGCYRTGKRPSEALHRQLEASRKALAHAASPTTEGTEAE